MTTTNKQPLDQQIKEFRQSSSFTPGDALSFSVKFTETLSLPGRHDPATYLQLDHHDLTGRVAIVCPGNGGLCVEALKRGFTSVDAFEPRNVYHKSIAKVAEFCKAILNKTYSYSTSKGSLDQGRYDLIIWSEGLDEIRDPATLFRGALEALKPGGAIYVEVSHGTHTSLPKSTNAWRPSIDSFESTIKSIGDLTIESRRPGRNQLRVIYEIRRGPAAANPTLVTISQDVETTMITEKAPSILQDEADALFGGPGETTSASTPKRRGRKPRIDDQPS